MKLLLTGIGGFVGSTLARYFVEDSPNWQIVGLDNFSRPGSEQNRLALRRLGIDVRHADLRCASDLESLPPVEAVIDAAANPSVLAGTGAAGTASSRQVVEHNLLGTVNLLEYSQRHRAAFLLLSSSRVYSISALAGLPLETAPDGQAFRLDAKQLLPPGASAQGITEDFSTRPPVSLYGATKLAAEILALEYGALHSFPVVVNRCGVLAGAGQFGRADQGIFAYWLHSWRQGHPLRYIGFGGHGGQVRDCLHPHDLARLVIRQLADPARWPEQPIGHVSGGSERAISLAQLSAWCTARWGAQPVASDPAPRPFDLPWVVLDSRRTEAFWNWRPQIALDSVLQEIARHAEAAPDWLELSAP